MNKYRQNKSKAVDLAIELQIKNSTKSISCGELAEQYEKLKNLAKRYGLIKEFRENGII